MFRNTFQSGFLSILYSIGSKPLQIWDKDGGWSGIPSTVLPKTWLACPSAYHCCILTCLSVRAVRNGHIKRITDNDIQSSVLEICSANVSTTYITCPAEPGRTLGIKLPFLVMIIKNLKKYFSFEVQVLDDKQVRRRFRASNYQVWLIAGSWPCMGSICFIPGMACMSDAMLEQIAAL